ncbi:MAG TPA: hypothetical protein VK892_03015, partial [Pyrinomonadaceae bacterium]|nr:hypothetical protein [Pyrinomonadaceae bacterium]
MRLQILILFVFALFISACVQAPPDQSGANDANRKVRIGFAMDTVKEERWQRDRELFQKRCDEV